MYEWALFLHLVGAIAFFAGMAVAAVAETAARGRRRLSEVAAILGTARRGVLLVAVGLPLAVGAGFWLLEETHYGFDGWIQAALALFRAEPVVGGAALAVKVNRRDSRSRAGREWQELRLLDDLRLRLLE